MKESSSCLVALGATLLWLLIPVIFLFALLISIREPQYEEYEYEEATYYMAEADIYTKFVFEGDEGDMKIMFSRDGRFEDTTDVDFVILGNCSWSEMLGPYHEGVTVQFDPYGDEIFTDNEGVCILNEENKIDTTYCKKRSVYFELRDTLKAYEYVGGQYYSKLKYPYVSMRFTNVWGERGYVELGGRGKSGYVHPNGDDKKREEEMDCFKVRDEYGNDIKYKVLTDSEVAVVRNVAYERMEKVKIPERVEWGGDSYEIVEIGRDAFLRARKMEEIELPNALKRIGVGAFYECESLKTVEIPEAVEEMGAFVFGECKDLEELEWPKQVVAISDYAFIECGKLEKVDGWEKVQKIGDGSFAMCERMKFRELPKGLKEVGNNAFTGCKSIDNITLPKGVLRIGDYAFRACVNMAEIVLQEGLREIGEGVFYMCTKISKLELPATVEKIESGYMQAIDTLMVKGENPFKMRGWLKDGVEIYVPDGSVHKFRMHKDWIEYGVKGMSEYEK